MPYATRAALIDRFGIRELIDRTDLAEPYTGEIVDAVLDRAIAAADAEIDAALRARYAVPLAPVPELVASIACDLARWHLWPTNPPEWVEDRAKAARASLDRIACGTLVLDATPVSTGGGEATAPAITGDDL